jgi:hypothetical protein
MVKEGFGGRIDETQYPLPVNNDDAVRVLIDEIAKT